MAAPPPLIPGENTLSFSAVNTQLTVYGDMRMPNTYSTMTIAGGIVAGNITTTNLQVSTLITAPALMVTTASIGTLRTTNNVDTVSSISTLCVTGTAQTTGLRVKESGSNNGKQGLATLASGMATVSNVCVTTNSRIYLTPQTISSDGTIGALCVSSRSAGVSFVISSSNPTDDSSVAFLIVEPFTS